MSKPCAHCLAIMCTLPQKKGYKINNIFYTDQNGTIEKKKLGELLNDDLHISRMYTDKNFKPSFHRVH
jgi:cytidine deaminase